jgi:hypothetical protein
MSKMTEAMFVSVLADEMGNVINVSPNNPEYGWIRVQQAVNQINDQGWLKKANRYAFIKGLVKDLQDCQYQGGSQIRGRIIVVESFNPFNPTNPEKNLKVAGNSGVVCRVNDQPIYRETFFTPNVEALDQLIMHNNSDEIKEVQAAQRSMASLSLRDEIEEVTL